MEKSRQNRLEKEQLVKDEVNRKSSAPGSQMKRVFERRRGYAAMSNAHVRINKMKTNIQPTDIAL